LFFWEQHLRVVQPDYGNGGRRGHDHWEHLKVMNVSKAHYIVSGEYSLPKRKHDISQDKIFKGQLSKFVNTDQQVAVLNSFPIFIFDYFQKE
jgi:hypothetical protein